MNYFELIPYELIGIIISYLPLSTNLNQTQLNPPHKVISDDLQNLMEINPIDDVMSNKSFWFNQLSLRGLDDFIPGYKLMINRDMASSVSMLEAYNNILMIKNYLIKFRNQYAAYFDLAVDSPELNMTKLMDPNDISYFQEHVKIDLIKKLQNGYFVSSYSGDTIVLTIQKGKTNYWYSLIDDISQYIEFVDMNRSEFIIILIKCVIFDIDIRKIPVSNVT